MRSGSKASTNRDRIRCLKCREYNHFAKDCLNLDTEKEQSEQIQQMFNLEEDKTALKILMANTYDDFITTNSDETIDHLKGKNDPTTFLPLNRKIGGPVKCVKDRKVFV